MASTFSFRVRVRVGVNASARISVSVIVSVSDNWRVSGSAVRVRPGVWIGVARRVATRVRGQALHPRWQSVISCTQQQR